MTVPAPLPPPSDDDTVGVGDLWSVLRRNWWVVALCVALAAAAAVAYLATATPVYEAVATLRIERQPSRYATLGSGALPPPTNQVETEMLELRSRQIAEDVARALGLAPVDSAGRTLSEHTTIGRPDANADVVTVRHEGPDPRRVQRVTNLWVERFLDRRREAQTAEARSAVRFLTRQLDTLTGRLGAAESELRRFREREGVVDIETQASTGVTRLAELQASRNALDAEWRALEGLLGEVRGAARQAGDASTYRRLAGFPSLLRNQATAELLSTLATLEDQRAQLLIRRELRDPDVQVLTTRITEVGEQLRTTAEAYLQGLSGQVAALDATLARSGQALGQLPARQVELARLQRTPQALGEVFTLLRTRLQEAQVAQAIDDPGVRLIDPAALPDEPVKPKPALVLGLALVLGAGLGVALALLRGALDPRVYRLDAVQALVGMPVLALIPRLRPSRGRAGARVLARASERDAARSAGRGGGRLDAMLVVGATDGASSGAEAFRRLRTNLLAMARHDGSAARTLLVASPLAGDGRTLVAANLGAAFARQGLRTLLVDADLRTGALAALVGLQPGPGLSDVLGPDATRAAVDGSVLPDLAGALRAAVQEVTLPDGTRLAVLGAGRLPPNPTELLGTPRFAALIASARETYDVVVIDSPPIRATADADVLAAGVDGVLLIARPSHTTTRGLGHAVQQLRNVGARVLGLVANDVRDARAG
jgi:capsular exopolysaccharide synthesis family protein